MKFAKSVMVLLFGLCCMAAAQSGNDLQTRFQNQVLFLKNFPIENQLNYDAKGNPEKAYASGPWTLGAMQIASIKSRRGKTEITGRRYGMKYNSVSKKMEPMSTGDEMKVVIQTDLQALTSAEFDDVWQRVFVTKVEVWPDLLPDYWRAYARKESMGSGKELTPGDRHRPLPVQGFVYEAAGKGIQAPRAITRSHPRYTELARRLKVGGTLMMSLIVDENGKPTQIEILKPVGMGLDEQAIEDLKSWRFEPGMKDGKVVAVKMAVEMSFNIY